ncbi:MULTISPECIES: MetQ/NlpA family ABC transporter substrate-binding protein [unclassified Achromobacter]|uniref:MetQ/NlpA family ABC transporter substrate-binding protein n=1 Tax=unclassified Achromobacter TaxID=2626865 RepID=UPI000B519E1F|nr:MULTISPECIES: MetQ/NlpA family ABC transporter substrate-binding protein [unclassified Achromobacter]OWT71619.1 methionine ABC transporter substrate-binding protein [Achromobacter sp. HZ34]OWT73276.1 methionine ABC transporter substrate-binding protein [Achromobacter sp. HZ28]
MKKLIALLALACAFSAQAADRLVVGASPTPHAEILENLKPMLAKEGVELDIRIYTDYVQPNVQLAEKRIDANFFQHKPYMDEFNRSRGTNIVAVSDIFVAPFGAYSSKVKNIKDLKDGATVAIPNDAVNGGRALQLLHQAGVIQLSDPLNTKSTVKDIAANPKNIKIKQLEAPMLPRVLPEVDLAVINTTFALEAKLNPTTDALFLEGDKSSFANLLAARPDNKDSPAMRKLVEALRSPQAAKFMQDRFKGSIVPVF